MLKTKIASRGLYKILGRDEEVRIEIGADQTLKVQVGTMKMVVPVMIAVALQTAQARAFVSDPAIAAFLYGSNERDSRLYAAEVLRRSALQDQRRDFVAACIGNGLAEEQEAWLLSKIKYPG